MPHYLLTGAGFSRNWGGWLANEAFEYLLGYPDIRPDVHAALWKSKNSGLGFENTLQELRLAAEKYKEQRFGENLSFFENMLQDMFNAMNLGFKDIELNPAFDPHTVGHSADYIRRFLASFDAIFTLNQDCLLELKYRGRDIHRLSDGRWRDMEPPGLQPVTSNGTPYQPPGVFKPGSKTYELDHAVQPYFKLHGSSNWRDGDASFLIMGGNKGPDIEKHWLLRSYRDRFIQMLCRKDVRLVVIGYSFQDVHINEVIEQAAQAGAKFFIIDPMGIDVLDRAPNPSNDARGYTGRLSASLLGGSRRELTTTFSTDHVERLKIQRFINRLGPGS
jgi:hypothetical protein